MGVYWELEAGMVELTAWGMAEELPQFSDLPHYSV